MLNHLKIKNYILMLTLSLVPFVLPGIAQHAVAAPSARNHHVFCDIKRSLVGLQAGLTIENYTAIIDSFRLKVGCDGIRLNINSQTSAEASVDSNKWGKESYNDLYHKVYSYARSKNMLIYANLLPEPQALEFGGNADRWISVVSGYANHFCPDFLGPFNENGKLDQHREISRAIQHRLKANCTDQFGTQIAKIVMVGPDSGSVKSLMKTMRREPGLEENFDIMSAHNNAGGANSPVGVSREDRSSSREDWIMMRRSFDKAIWASEIASGWDSFPVSGRNMGKNVGVQAAVTSGAVDAIVLYAAVSLLENGTYNLNPKGLAISEGLRASGWIR